jgi:hypothetical protein
MDISETTQPKSDQQQYDDFIDGSTRTVTVSAVTKGSPEQPINVELEEYPGRPFRPNKTMRRLLLVAWGKDSTAYVGRRLKLVGNPNVMWGGKAVGGVEIAALSHINQPLTVALTTTRGRRAPFTVQPLPTPQNATQRDWLAELRLAGNDLSAVNKLGHAAKEAGASDDILNVMRGVLAELQS